MDELYCELYLNETGLKKKGTERHFASNNYIANAQTFTSFAGYLLRIKLYTRNAADS